MYSRIKSTLLNHFQKSTDTSKEDKKKLRHSLAECQLTDSAHFYRGGGGGGHAPLAPAENDEDTTSDILSRQLQQTKRHHSSQSFLNRTLYSEVSEFADDDEGEEEEEEVEDIDDYSDSVYRFSEIPKDQEDSIMPHFALSWSVQYLGSFPISNLSSDYIGQRLERFQPIAPAQNVELSVSLIGVRVKCEQLVLMSHSLRRVCSVVGRPSFRQVAYIALEPAGRTYRRLCHVFQTTDVEQIEQIENVLGQAFNAQTLTKGTTKSQTTTNISSDFQKNMTQKDPSSTMNEKRSASTVFLNRFLGKKGGGSQTVDEASCKRKRRPVSAVFSSAIHRLSTSTTSMTPKRMTTTDLIKETSSHQQQPTIQTVEEAPRRCRLGGGSLSSSGSASGSASGSSTTSSASDLENQKTELIFDEKLGEWIYPIDSSITSQLENCNYFVGLPSRESLNRNLMSQPEGAFVIRYSESKRKCLALSMRVPLAHNPTGISHYLIIRNQQGFRLKFSGSNKPFPSLQMLLTHHSVLEGSLPCTLYFVQWDKSSWKQHQQQQQQVTVTPVPPTTVRHHRHSTALTKIDENRNLSTSITTPLGRRCGHEDYSTPKRRSRHDLNAMRRSQFFELDHQRIIS